MLRHNLYQILNIPQHIIVNQQSDMHYWVSLIDSTDLLALKLEYVNKAIDIANRFHSYLHFEQSFLYLLSAYIQFITPQFSLEKVQFYLNKALFQDPLNKIATNFLLLCKNEIVNDIDVLYSYDKHFKYEQDFLKFAIGDFFISEELITLDDNISIILSQLKSGDDIKSNKLKISDAPIYNSHRYHIMMAIAAIQDDHYNRAEMVLEKALQLFEKSHINYHELASDLYKIRSSIFNQRGDILLAKNDLIKADDLVGNRHTA